MNANLPKEDSPDLRPRWPRRIIAAALLLTMVIAVLLCQHSPNTPVSNPDEARLENTPEEAVQSEATAPDAPRSRSTAAVARRHLPTHAAAAQAAKQTVTAKISQFTRKQRDMVAALARQFRVELPPEVSQLFDAIQADDWDKARETWGLLQQRRQSEEQPEGMHKLWHALVETYGAAEAAHTWNPQDLLDYGNAILDSLAPETVYFGGSDAGRFIPALLNETANDRKHIVLTQSALADASYLEYVAFRYGDRVLPPDAGEQARAFQEYINDAQKRYEHDQQFPNEPKQVRPGEQLHSSEGHFRVAGETAVMAINEKLLQALLEKNPGVRFALEESFSFDSVYPNAAPRGPILELRAQHGPDGLTAEQVNKALDYWGTRAQQFGFGSDPNEAPEARAAWSKMAAAQGKLFLAHEYTGEAEQAFRLAQEISPATPQAVLPLVTILAEQNRAAEAIPLLERALELAPENANFQELLSQLRTAAP